MKRKKFTILLLSVITVFIAIFAVNIHTNSAAENKSSEKCLECHADSVEFKEWQNSAHAKALQTILKEPKADSRCLKCHTSDYNLYTNTNLWGAPSKPMMIKDAKNAVSCSSCHRHDSGIKHNLIMPVDKLCISCHKFDCG
jgi:predicted CXXCH cytochrome family protein